MSNGYGDLEFFLDRQVDFTEKLCAAAMTAKFAEPENIFKCPTCGGALIKRNGKTGEFWACTNYPDCKTTFADDDGKPDFDGKIRSARLLKEGAPKCPTCGGALVKRHGKNGDFWACTNYPDCKTTFEDDDGKPDFDGKIRSARLLKEGAPKCPTCGGALIKRHGKNGDFWGCSNYPKCRTTFDDKDGKPDFDGKKFLLAQNFSAPDDFNPADFEPIISSADYK